MQYMLLIHSNEAAVLSAPKEATERMHVACMAYTEALTRACVAVGGNRLRPSSATVQMTGSRSAMTTENRSMRVAGGRLPKGALRRRQ